MTPIIDDLRKRLGLDGQADWLPPEPDPVSPSAPGVPADPAPTLAQQIEQLRSLNRIMAQQKQIIAQLADYKKKFGVGETDPAESPIYSQEVQDYLQLGLYSFFPYLIPLKEAAEHFPKIRPFGFDISPASLLDSLKEFGRRAEESRKAFDQSIEGAIRNPTSLDDLSKGDLFVIEEDALNEIIASVLEKSPAGKKLKNVKVVIDGDELKISGEYKTKLMWVDFTAKLDLEQENGKTSGSLRKIKAVGFDLTSLLKEDILNAFRQFDLEPPEDAELKDLSWVHLPGIKRLEIRHDMIILEREPLGTGPT